MDFFFLHSLQAEFCSISSIFALASGVIASGNVKNGPQVSSSWQFIDVTSFAFTSAAVRRRNLL